MAADRDFAVLSKSDPATGGGAVELDAGEGFQRGKKDFGILARGAIVEKSGIPQVFAVFSIFY